MESVRYCRQCVLNDGDPTVTIDDSGLCSVCRQETIHGAVDNYDEHLLNCQEFERVTAELGSDDGYSCLLMLSGGKDSVNMLYELVAVRGLKVLSYTFNHPFENSLAQSNIQKALKKLNCEHVLFTPNEAAYKDLMRHMFLKAPQDLPEPDLRKPCHVCAGLMKLTAFMFCCRMGIPYFLYCADPFQMAEQDATVTKTAKMLLDVLGMDMLSSFIDAGIFEKVLEESPDLPKIIYPYATCYDYDEKKLVNKLRGLGIYEGSPRATHCSLYTLLNYYSFVYGDSWFYAHEISFVVRSGELPRDLAMRFLEEYKSILFGILTKREKSEAERERVRQFFQTIHTSPVSLGLDTKTLVQEEVQNALSFIDTLDELNLSLEDIKKRSDLDTISFEHTRDRARMRRDALKRHRKGVAKTRRHNE
jgi:hypothetical protein